MAVPPTAMSGSGRLAVWFKGGCCAPVTVRARPFRVDRVGGGPQRHARGDGGGFCVVFHLDSVDCAAPRVGGLPASGTYSAGAGSPASHARVGGWCWCSKSLHHRCLPEVGPVVAVQALRAWPVVERFGVPVVPRGAGFTVGGAHLAVVELLQGLRNQRDRCSCAAPSASRARRRTPTR